MSYKLIGLSFFINLKQLQTIPCLVDLCRFLSKSHRIKVRFSVEIKKCNTNNAYNQFLIFSHSFHLPHIYRLCDIKDDRKSCVLFVLIFQILVTLPKRNIIKISQILVVHLKHCLKIYND